MKVGAPLPDAGQQEPDAGALADAGVDERDGGADQPSQTLTGCGCVTVEPALGWALLMALTMRSRRGLRR
jgi:hypothetical protein